MTHNSLLPDHIIYQEMMSHAIIFSHPQPKNIAIIGDEHQEILQEVAKHPDITCTHHTSKNSITHVQPESLDILIISEPASPDYFENFFKILNSEGILIQKATSPFEIAELKSLQQHFIRCKFTDIHFLSFPQPQFPSGWITAIIAKKNDRFRRIRERDIFNKPFSTQYYNFDIHKASLVLPEFMRKELEPITE